MMYPLALDEFIRISGEDKAKEALSSFFVLKNPDVERFIKQQPENLWPCAKG